MNDCPGREWEADLFNLFKRSKPIPPEPSLDGVDLHITDILFRNMVGHPTHRLKLREFLATADRKDSGPAACEKCFGCRLAELVKEFLGPGPWDNRVKNEAGEGGARGTNGEDFS